MIKEFVGVLFVVLFGVIVVATSVAGLWIPGIVSEWLVVAGTLLGVSTVVWANSIIKELYKKI